MEHCGSRSYICMPLHAYIVVYGKGSYKCPFVY
jgi:hypothetical protein